MIFTGREVGTLSKSIGGGLRRAFDGLVFDGMKLPDALRRGEVDGRQRLWRRDEAGAGRLGRRLQTG